MNGQSIRDPQASEQAKEFLGQADSWREARARLMILYSPTLPDTTLTEDVAAVRHLLKELTAKDVSPDESIESGPLLVELVDAASKFRQNAAWNSLTIDHLSTAGQLTLPGKFLIRGLPRKRYS